MVTAGPNPSPKAKAASKNVKDFKEELSSFVYGELYAASSAWAAAAAEEERGRDMQAHQYGGCMVDARCSPFYTMNTPKPQQCSLKRARQDGVEFQGG